MMHEQARGRTTPPNRIARVNHRPLNFKEELQCSQLDKTHRAGRTTPSATAETATTCLDVRPEVAQETTAAPDASITMTDDDVAI